MNVNGNDITIEIGASADKAINKTNQLIGTFEKLKNVFSQKIKSPLSDAATFDAAKLERQLNSVDKSIERTQKKLYTFRNELQSATKTGVNTDSIKNAIAEQESMLSALKKQRNSLTKGTAKLKIDSSDADKATKKMTGLQKVFSAFKRIAFYRAIRSAIRFVTDGFKEGLQNAYQFSKNVGGPLSSALDNLSSAGFRMKNQLGAAFGQLLVAVTPILLKLIDIVTAAANAITQFFALISGQTTYKKATNYWKEWGDAASGAGSAAKEALKYLAPFDELNVLPSASSSGGGGGTSATDYENMFEETELSDWAKKLQPTISWIKDNFDSILEVAKAIGVTIAAWKVSGFLAKLFGGGMKTTVGLTLLVTSIVLAIENIKSIKSGEYDFTSAKGTGIAAATGGAAGLGVAILAGLTGGTALIPIGVGVALSLIITSVAVNWEHIKGQWSKTFAGDFAGAQLEHMNMDSWTTKLEKWTVDRLWGEGTWENVKTFLEKYPEEANKLLTEDLMTFPNFITSLPEKLKNGVASTKKWFGEQWDQFTGDWGEKWGSLKQWWENVDIGHFIFDIMGWLKEKWDSISGWFSEKWNGLTEWWHGLSIGSFKFDLIEKITTKWNDFTTWISEKWNSLKKWWENLSLGQIKIPRPELYWSTVPAGGWVADVLKALGLPLSVPKLNVKWNARGGIVDGATLIGAGEAGKEAIVPLERNTQWVGMVAGQLANQLGNQNSGGYNADLADDLEDANGVVVNAIFSATAEIVRAMSRNGGNAQSNGIDIDAVARQVTRWQNNRARAAGI